MKSKLLLAAVAASLAFTAACEQQAPAAKPIADAAPTTAESAEGKKLDDIRGQTLVNVNGSPIKGEMYGIFLGQRLQQSRGKSENTPQFQNQVINELINIMLLSQAASDSGLAQKSEVVTALELQRHQALSRLALQEYSQKHKPTDEQLKALYDERYVAKPEEEYKARHILVKTEDEAKALIEQLNGGGDFAELAKEHSTGPTGAKGGDLGWFGAGQMVKPFSEAVMSMEIGAVSSMPVKTQFGYHVIKLEEKRAKEAPSFESVKAKLAGDVQRQNLTAYVNTLREGAKVELDETFVKKQQEAKAANEAAAAKAAAAKAEE